SMHTFVEFRVHLSATAFTAELGRYTWISTIHSIEGLCPLLSQKVSFPEKRKRCAQLLDRQEAKAR
ncbi:MULTISPECIES: hypothetical protein, partial [unclassified Paenibacillus]|uniref:hypothetical protein n=1 Tax=unclassified Paenibacillus TaxID=185978 RepID=UPI00362EC70D